MRRVLLLLAVSTAALGLLGGSAQATARSCPAHRGTLARDSLGRVWHQGRSLYACTITGDRAPRSRRMGPWTPSTRVGFDGATVAWTTRVARVLVGAWPDTPAAELAARLRLDTVPGEGEGDDCGGVDVFEATITPRGAAAPVGVRWASSYVTRSQACNTDG